MQVIRDKRPYLKQFELIVFSQPMQGTDSFHAIFQRLELLKNIKDYPLFEVHVRSLEDSAEELGFSSMMNTYNSRVTQQGQKSRKSHRKAITKAQNNGYKYAVQLNGETAILTDKTEKDQGFSIGDMTNTVVLMEQTTEQLMHLQIDYELMTLNQMIKFMLREDFEEFTTRLTELQDEEDGFFDKGLEESLRTNIFEPRPQGKDALFEIVEETQVQEVQEYVVSEDEFWYDVRIKTGNLISDKYHKGRVALKRDNDHWFVIVKDD